MGYENAPATEMMATHCGVCGKELVDSVSLEYAMGPHCRKKYLGGLDALDDTAREQANLLIHRLAVEQTGSAALATACELRLLGFARLADRVVERCADIVVTEVDYGVIAVKAPYDPAAIDEMRRIPGRRWHKERKVNTFPEGAKQAVWGVFRRCYPGMVGVGPKGVFVVN